MERAGDIAAVFVSDWFFLSVAALIYWTLDKQIGIKLFIVLSLSAYFHELVKQTFAPVPSGNDPDFTFPAGEVQLAASFWGYLIPEIAKKRFTAAACIIIGITALITWTYSSHSYQDIIMAVLLGVFIVYVVYRTMDWIGSVPEHFLFSFSLVLPSSLLLLFPEGGQYAGLLLGGGVGCSLERLKCRMVISRNMQHRAATAAVGLTGLLLLSWIQIILPSTILVYFLHSALLGFWITLITPWISIMLGWNEQRGRLHVS